MPLDDGMPEEDAPHGSLAIADPVGDAAIAELEAAVADQAKPPQTHVGISIVLTNDLLKYLDTKPHSEVRVLIDRLTQEAQASLAAGG